MKNILKDVVPHDILMIINEYMNNIKTFCNGCSKNKFDKYYCIECDEFKCDECNLLDDGVC